MIGIIKKLLGIGGNPVNLSELAQQGALIIDVRSQGEFASGHIKGAINIPVDQLSKNFAQLKDKQKPIITCCASGMRSASAKSILKANGYTQVHNGGGWLSLKNKLGK